MLADYLARIGLTDRPDATVAGLDAVQRAHRMAIGFENLDVMLGRPVAVDLAGVWAKLRGRRGGYCFEHNALFGAMLAALGLPNRPLLARVWLGLAGPGPRAQPGPDTPPRTHTLRLVRIDGADWLADAGFGGSYVPPLPLRDGAGSATPDGACHRLCRIGDPGAAHGAWLIERRGPVTATDGRTACGDSWAPQYSFDLAEVTAIDLALSNWWTSTRPGTRFTLECRASIVLPDGFAALNGRMLSRHAGGQGETIELTRAADWREVLDDLFHIALDADEVARLGLF